MYKEFYLMQKEPFDSHPSPEIFYKSRVHQNGWSYLLQGIRQHEPILLLVGDYGAGKTLLYLKLIKLLKKRKELPYVGVSTPTYNFSMVLEKLIERLLNISPGEIASTNESRLQQVIYEYFENKARIEKKREFIYVIIDDAQEFSYSFLNKLRIFASYNFSGHFPIRIILFAHYDFLEKLNYKKIVAFGQRIRRIFQLEPLGFEETREYIYFRLLYSGATGTPVFDDEAISIIQSASEGNPRLINNACDNCLLLASSEKNNLISTDLVYRALKEKALTGLKKLKRPEKMPGELKDEQFYAPPERPRQHQSQPGPPPQSQPGPPLQRPSGPPPQQPIPPQVHHQVYPQPMASPAGQPRAGWDSEMPNGYANGVSSGGGGPNGPVPIQPGGASAHYVPSYEEQYPEPLREKRKIRPTTPMVDTKIKSDTFLSRYGKIFAIIVMAMILVFLISYLLNQQKAENMWGGNGRDEGIMKGMPAHHYVIKKPGTGKQVEAEAEAVESDIQLYVSPADKSEELNTGKRYQPVLITENFGG